MVVVVGDGDDSTRRAGRSVRPSDHPQGRLASSDGPTPPARRDGYGRVMRTRLVFSPTALDALAVAAVAMIGVIEVLALDAADNNRSCGVVLRWQRRVVGRRSRSLARRRGVGAATYEGLATQGAQSVFTWSSVVGACTRWRPTDAADGRVGQHPFRVYTSGRARQRPRAGHQGVLRSGDVGSSSPAPGGRSHIRSWRQAG